MDETTKAIIDRITVRYPKPTKIPTGHECLVYYDCIQLTPTELARMAAEATGERDHHLFDVAVGLAYAGIFFAAAVAGGRHVAILQTDGEILGPPLKGKRVVVVDDVVHSGRKIARAGERLQAAGAEVVGFACIVDRSGGEIPALKHPLWSAYQTVMA